MDPEDANLPAVDQKLADIKKRLASLRAEADGPVAADDAARLDRIDQMISEIEGRAPGYLPLTGPGMEGSEEDSPEACDEMGAAGRRFDREAEIRRLRKHICKEYIQFRDALKDWCTESKTALNTALGFAGNTPPASNVTLSDVMLVLSNLFPPSRFAAKAATVAGAHIIRVTTKAMSAVRVDGPGGRVLINDVRNQMERAIDEVKASIDVCYDAFLEERIPRLHRRRDFEKFFEDCIKFEETMPTQDETKKAFIQMVVDATPDTHDIDSPGVGGSGYVYIDLEFSMAEPDLAPDKVLYGKTMLDDVDEPTVEALRNVWAGDVVINLPFPISMNGRSSIFDKPKGESNRRVIASYALTLTRSSKTPGDMGFAISWTKEYCENGRESEHKRAIEAHMRKLVSEMPVSQLDSDAWGL